MQLHKQCTRWNSTLHGTLH